MGTCSLLQALICSWVPSSDFPAQGSGGAFNSTSPRKHMQVSNHPHRHRVIPKPLGKQYKWEQRDNGLTAQRGRASIHLPGPMTLGSGFSLVERGREEMECKPRTFVDPGSELSRVGGFVKVSWAGSLSGMNTERT